jgi:PilZ domain
MRATNRAIPIDSAPSTRSSPGPQAAPSSPASAPPSPEESSSVLRLPPLRLPPIRVPQLRITPLLKPSMPRRFVRVPTHAVGVFPEHREYPRAALRLPLRLRAVNGLNEEFPITLVTRDISSTGVFFLSPKMLAMGASLELEIVLVSRPMGCGNVVVTSRAQVRRVEPAATPDWFGIAASYDDMQFGRDDGLHLRRPLRLGRHAAEFLCRRFRSLYRDVRANGHSLGPRGVGKALFA